MYFLAIVTKENLLCGEITPCYVLCKSKGKSENRSGMRVMNLTIKQHFNMPKILVHDMNGHDDLLDFLSAFRTRRHMHGSKRFRHHNTMKYFVEGALFWFTCNQYGEQNGPAYFARAVPVPEMMGKTIDSLDQGFNRWKEAQNRPPPDLKELLTGEPMCIPYGEDVHVEMPDAKWSRRNPKFKVNRPHGCVG